MTSTRKLAELCIGLMGIWMIIRDVPDMIGSWVLYRNRIWAVTGDPLEMTFAGLFVPLSHILVGMVLGAVLLIMKSLLARFLVPNDDDQVNLTAQQLINVAILGFSIWLIANSVMNWVYVREIVWLIWALVAFALTICALILHKRSLREPAKKESTT